MLQHEIFELAGNKLYAVNRKNLFFLVAFLALAGLATAFYLWNKPHRDVQSEKPQFQINAEELRAQLQSDPTQLAGYLDQVVLLQGRVTESAEDHIVVDEFAYVELLEPGKTPLEFGTPIVIKARVVAFDELFGQLRLDQGALEP